MTAERFIIRGNLGATTFLPWVARHARKLGLKSDLASADAGEVELLLEGPPDMIDAMEMGVSLGPIEAWIESILRSPLNRHVEDEPVAKKTDTF